VKNAKMEKEVEKQVKMICSRMAQMPMTQQVQPVPMYGYPYAYPNQPMLQQLPAKGTVDSDSDSD
jgi:hypothetical protein